MKTTDKRHRLMKYLLAGVLILPIGAQRLLNVKAVDLDTDCSLTVDPGDYDYLKEYLNKVPDGVKIDLYQVAGAVKDPKYDTFTFELKSDFDSSLDGYDISAYSGDAAGTEYLADLDVDDWVKIAQQFTKTVNDGSPAVTATVDAYKPAEGLEAGLYLVLARSKDLTDKKDYLLTNSDGDYVTIANAEAKVYTYRPELISLPSSFTDDQIDAMDTPVPPATIDKDTGDIMTSNGNWMYDIKAVLKPTEEDRIGKIKIVKIVQNWDDRSEASFFFEAYGKNGEYEYDRVTQIDFGGAGTDFTELENVRVGTEISVTELLEERGPSNYELVSWEVKEDTKTDGKALVRPLKDADGNDIEPLTFIFIDKCKPSRIKGYGIKNTFTYDEDNGWQNPNDTAKTQ